MLQRIFLEKKGSSLQEVGAKTWMEKGNEDNFSRQAMSAPNQLSADLVFVIDEKTHEIFRRDGNDLLMNYKVTLAETIGGLTVEAKTLDSRGLLIPVNEIISPGYEVLVSGEGMPIAKEPGNRGDLKIRFDVKFPTRLTTEQRAALKRVLEG